MNYTTMELWYTYLALLLAIKGERASCLTCYQCESIKNPRDCYNAVSCRENQVCGSSRYRYQDGSTMYRLHCTDSNKCTQTSILPGVVGKRRATGSHILLNSTCCGTNYCNTGYSVSNTNEGFLIVLPVLAEVSDDSATSTIEIYADYPCVATLEDGYSGRIRTIYINAGLNIFPMNDIYTCCPSGKGDPFSINGGYDRSYYLKTQCKVSVFVRWQMSYDITHVSDKYMIIPSDMLGTNFIISNIYRYSTKSNCLIATENDNTVVQIEFNTTNYINVTNQSFENETGIFVPKGNGYFSVFNSSGAFMATTERISKTYRLNRLDKLVLTEGFLTGSRITSNYPIAVYMEERDLDSCYFQPYPQCLYSRSNLVNSLPSTDSYGTNFILPILHDNINSRIRIITEKYPTRVKIVYGSNIITDTVLTDRYYEYDSGSQQVSPIYITSDHPILVMVFIYDQFKTNSSNTGSTLFFLPSIDRYTNKHRIHVSKNQSINKTCTISLIVPDDGQDVASGIQINQRPLRVQRYTVSELKNNIFSGSVYRLQPQTSGYFNIDHTNATFGSLVFCYGTCSPDRCGAFQDDKRIGSLSASAFSGGISVVH